MDSPDRNSPTSASEFEGSPLFNFLCSLSPIKPVKSARVAQTYSEISFPPPLPVFVSPKVDGKKESTSLQRDKCTTEDEVKTARNHAFLHPTERIQKFRGATKPQNNRSSASPCSSPSKLVKEYLAELEDNLQDNVSVQEVFTSNDETSDNPSDVKTLKQEALQNGPHSGQSVMRGRTNTQSTGDQTFCNATSTHMQIPLGIGMAKKDIMPNFDNEASELEFLMSDEDDEPPDDLCLENWHHVTSSLSELSVEQVEGYIASLRGMVDEKQVAAVGVSNAGMDVIENESFTNDMVAEHEFKSDQGGVVAGRKNPPTLRGVRRRCLDFEVSEGHLESKTSLVSLQPLSANPDTGCQDETTCEAELSGSLLVLKKRVSATIDGAFHTESVQGDTPTKCCSRKDGMTSIKMTRATSINITVSHSSSTRDGACAPKNAGTPPAPSGMPSGIGLHLNSLTGGMPCTQPPREIDGSIGSVGSYKAAHAHSGCSPRMDRKSAESTQKSLLLAHAAYARGVNFKQVLVAPHRKPMEDCQVESECSGLDVDFSKAICVRSVAVGAEQMGENVPSNQSSKGPSPLGRKRILSQEVELEGAEEYAHSPSSPKKKRKTASVTEKSGDSCKRCNCKKSKCLKLYCECFAAGVYCVGSCTCHDCFNKPEFEETVMDTRQQIQSRNPLAFAPKIIQASELSPTKREACRDTPASARHKRGCNCKKSQCLKKYCECFQAGVGCSDGCRCENCQNVHGRKEGTEDSDDKDILMEVLVSEEVAEEHTDTLEACKELLHAPPHPTHDLSPITPAFQHAGQQRILAKSSPSNKRRSSSEELHSPTFALSSAKPSRSPSRVLRSCRGTENSSPMASSGIMLPKFGSSPVSTPRILRIGRFSPRWDGLDDICTLTPGLQVPLRPTPASASVVDKSECSPSINEQTCNELSSSANPSARHGPKFTCLTSPLSHHESSECQSPAHMESTPLLSSPACTTDKASCLDNSGALVHQLDDDGTPEFLKQPEQGYSPFGLVNSSSPKHKRVSPPHHHALREASRRGVPSPGLRNSRKFILQSVPSVPSTLRE